MSGWDELLGRLTNRLSVDPELRLDVAAELRAHLEDSAGEFRRAGQNEAEAADSAAAALGDEAELAEQLWQANRARIRLRGVFRWTARAALIPAAIVVIGAVMFGLAVGPESGVDRLQGGNWDLPVLWTDHLSEQQRFILWGDPEAKTLQEAAKSIADRWPENPIYYGNYVTTLSIQSDLYRDGKPDPDRLDEVLAIFDQGERIDPDNAYYNFRKAAWLVGTAATVTDDPSRSYEWKTSEGEARQKSYYRIDVHDPAKLQRGLEEFRRGLGKPEHTTRSIEMLELRLAILPEPTRYNDHVRRLELEIPFLFESFWKQKELARALSAHAVALAEKGQADQAVALIDSVGVLATKMGARGRSLIELLVAQGIRVTGLTHAERVHRELERPADAAKAHGAFIEEVAFHNDLRNRGGFDKGELVHGGLMSSIFAPG
ncbi:hypothetical protein LCGC14_1744550, partial [marine sediment metagenome]